MILSCPSCESVDVELYADNGAEYPQTRVEFYACRHCENRFKKVLTA